MLLTQQEVLQIQQEVLLHQVEEVVLHQVEWAVVRHLLLHLCHKVVIQVEWGLQEVHQVQVLLLCNQLVLHLHLRSLGEPNSLPTNKLELLDKC